MTKQLLLKMETDALFKYLKAELNKYKMNFMFIKDLVAVILFKIDLLPATVTDIKFIMELAILRPPPYGSKMRRNRASEIPTSDRKRNDNKKVNNKLQEVINKITENSSDETASFSRGFYDNDKKELPVKDKDRSKQREKKTFSEQFNEIMRRNQRTHNSFNVSL